MKKPRMLAVLFGMLVGSCIAIADARADIFMFTDEGGTPHFSNVQSDKRYRLFMQTEQPVVHVDAPQSTPSVYSRNRAIFTPEIKRAACFC